MFGNAGKISAQDNAHRCLRQCLIHAGEGFQPRFARIHRQNRLVNLHIFHAFCGDGLQQLLVNGQQLGHQRFDAAAEVFFFLAQPQQRERSNQCWLNDVSLRFGFANLRDDALGMRGELGVGMPFGHDVVVVGVKPFGHFHGKLGGVAACQFKILR